MSDTTQKTLEIVLKGRDDGASSMMDRVGRRATTLAQQLRAGGDIGELTGVKKFGKNLGEFMGLSDNSATIKDNAEQMRAEAAAKLTREFKAINEELATGQASELRSAKLMDLKNQAAEKYKKTLQEINAAENGAIKEDRSGKGVARGIAVAGGTLAAVNFAGGIAEAWEKASKTIGERVTVSSHHWSTEWSRNLGVVGTLLHSEFVGEFAKGLPIIGSTIQKAETLAMVISGLAKYQREVTAEAAKYDKIISGQNADRKRVDDVVGGVTGLNDNEKQRINREANAKLKEIQDARKAGEASGVVNAGNDRDLALKKAEADVIRKREADLAKVEASERENRARHVADVEGRIEDSRKTVEEQKIQARIADLKAQGKDQEAAELQIHADADAKRRELDSQRKKLAGENGLTDAERIALGKSIEAQVDAVGEAEQRAVAAARAQATKENADKGAEEAVKAIKQAQDLIDKETEARKQLGITSIANQSAARTSITDARGQTSFIAQSREVNQPQVENTKATKDNTKVSADLTATLRELLTRLQNGGSGTTGTAGFIG